MLAASTLPAAAQSQKITVMEENDALPPSVQKRSVALVVQNHCSGNLQLLLSALTDTIVARLAEDGSPHHSGSHQQSSDSFFMRVKVK